MSRERKPLNRARNFLKQGKIFVLAYEGNQTEPQYYEELKKQLRYSSLIVDIESLKRNNNDTNSAPKHVFQKLKEKKQEYNFRDKDEFWMIIDRDRWKLDEWVEKCKAQKNFYIALSNPCFEFWLLLHFFDLDTFTDQELQAILENKKVSSSKNYIETYLSANLKGGYNKKKIKPARFLALDKIKIAIKQAKGLKSNDVYKELGSDNYLLVERILGI